MTWDPASLLLQVDLIYIQCISYAGKTPDQNHWKTQVTGRDVRDPILNPAKNRVQHSPWKKFGGSNRSLADSIAHTSKRSIYEIFISIYHTFHSENSGTLGMVPFIINPNIHQKKLCGCLSGPNLQLGALHPKGWPTIRPSSFPRKTKMLNPKSWRFGWFRWIFLFKWDFSASFHLTPFIFREISGFSSLLLTLWGQDLPFLHPGSPVLIYHHQRKRPRFSDAAILRGDHVFLWLV